MVHVLKLTWSLYPKVSSEEKTFEIRYDDRGYQVGDILYLCDYNEDTDRFTGKVCEVRVTYVASNASGFKAVMEGYVVMAIHLLRNLEISMLAGAPGDAAQALEARLNAANVKPECRLKNLYAVVGPSGSGKTTLVNLLCSRHALHKVKITTTKKSCGSDDDYYFVTTKEFASIPKVLCRAMYCGAWYGITVDALDAGDLIIVEPTGAEELKKLYDRPVLTIGLGARREVLESRLRESGLKKCTARLEYDQNSFSGLQDSVDFYCAGLGIEDTYETVLSFIDRMEDGVFSRKGKS